jgi:hypothetical protein
MRVYWPIERANVVKDTGSYGDEGKLSGEK